MVSDAKPIIFDCSALIPSLKFLGRGRFGTVELSTSKEFNDKQVAIKKAKLAQPELESNEMHMLFRFNDTFKGTSNTCRILGVCIAGVCNIEKRHGPCIALEYFSGGSLLDNLQTPVINIESGWFDHFNAVDARSSGQDSLLLPIVRRVVYLSKALIDEGFLHGDMHLGNLLLRRPINTITIFKDEDLVLSDFSHSKERSSTKAPITLEENPNLPVPPNWNEHTQLFSVGKILYHMLVGESLRATEERLGKYVPNEGCFQNRDVGNIMNSFPTPFSDIIICCLRSPTIARPSHDTILTLLSGKTALLPTITDEIASIVPPPESNQIVIRRIRKPATPLSRGHRNSR